MLLAVWAAPPVPLGLPALPAAPALFPFGFPSAVSPILPVQPWAKAAVTRTAAVIVWEMLTLTRRMGGLLSGADFASREDGLRSSRCIARGAEPTLGLRGYQVRNPRTGSEPPAMR